MFQVLLHPTTPLQRSIVLRCTLHRGKPILLPLSLTKILRQRSSLVLGERLILKPPTNLLQLEVKKLTSTPQRLPDSPFPRSLSPKPYKNPGIPYRKVDPPHRDPSSDPSAQTSPPALEIRRDSFKGTESESEGEKTPTAEPKESPRHKPAPVLAPVGPESGAKAKAPEKWPVKPDPSKVKGPSAKPRLTPSPTDSPRRTPTRTPPKTPPKSPPKTPPPPPTIPTAPPTGPAPMGTVDEIKEALIESNRVANMPIPQFYGKKGEKPEDHIMKVKDYFQNYKITDQKKMCD